MCDAAGIWYLHAVDTSQGGVDPEAAKALRILHHQVAAFQNSAYDKVNERFEIEIDLILLKGAFRADRRRQNTQTASRGIARNASCLDAAMILELP